MSNRNYCFMRCFNTSLKYSFKALDSDKMCALEFEISRCYNESFQPEIFSADQTPVRKVFKDDWIIDKINGWNCGLKYPTKQALRDFIKEITDKLDSLTLVK
jgi:hypothetical protein